MTTLRLRERVELAMLFVFIVTFADSSYEKQVSGVTRAFLPA